MERQVGLIRILIYVSVYPAEKLAANDKWYHPQCFKCTVCKGQLKLGNYAALNGALYCKPHFKQLFMAKGNYSEGFGHLKPQQEYELVKQIKEGGADSEANDEVHKLLLLNFRQIKRKKN